MVKINHTIEYNGKTFKRLSKKGLETYLIDSWLFHKQNSVKVYVLPCKANIYSEWIEFFSNNITHFEQLEKWLNEVR